MRLCRKRTPGSVTKTSRSSSLGISRGILAYGTLISQLYQGTIDIENKVLTPQTQRQWILFFGGIVVLGGAIFVRNVI